MIEKIQIICGDFDEAIKGLSNESAGRLFKALIAFAEDRDPSKELGDNVPANILFPVLKNHIIRNEDYRKMKSNAGKKGGGQLGNQNASKDEQKRAETSKNEQKRAPNLTLPNLTSKKNNRFNEGAVNQTYDFQQIEKKVVKN